MAPIATDSKTEIVRKALTSVELCSAAIVNLLNDLLYPPAVKARPTAAPPKTTTKRIKTESASPISVTSPGLTVPERHRFATEIVNLCLKTLATCVRQEQSQKLSQTKDATPKTLGKGKLLSAAIQPLQSRSSNKTTSPNHTDPAGHIAECCRIAIKYLYLIQHSPELKNPIAPLQFETAHNIFINRLIALKLYDQVTVELRSLRKRLDAFLDISSSGVQSWLVDVNEEKTGKKASSNARANSKTVKKENVNNKSGCQGLAELMIFSSVSASTVDLIMGYQNCILRTISGLGKPQLIEALPSALSKPNNYFSLLKSSNQPSTKFVAFDSLITSYCPSSAISADSSAKNPSISPSPQAIIQLQTIALEARCLAKLRKVEEIWESLSRYLTAFIRRTSQKEYGKERYKIARESTKVVQASIKSSGLGAVDGPPENIIQILCTAAFDGGLAEEGAKWIEKATSAQEKSGKANDATRAAAFIRLATLCLRELHDSPSSATSDTITTINTKIRDALESTEKVSKARTDEFERLLQEMAHFRRAATAVATSPVGKEGPDSSGPRAELRELLFRITDTAITFYRRYLKFQPSDTARVRKFAIPAIDSVVLRVSRVGGDNLLDQWDSLDLCLINCLELSKTLEESTDLDLEEDLDRHSEFEKIAEAYWTIACKFVRANGPKREKLKAIKRSVDPLYGRPSIEKARSNMARRLDYLGAGWLEADDTARAEETFREGIRSLSEEGVMDEILEQADKMSLNALFHSNGVGKLFGRILEGLLRCTLRDSEKKNATKIPFDDESLDKEIRGLALEWQLTKLVGSTSSGVSLSVAVARKLLGCASSQLLGLYTEKEPLRRARVISRVLRMELDHPKSWDIDEINELGEEVDTMGPLARDHSLRPHREYIVTKCRISYAFLQYRNGVPRPDMLLKCVNTWRELVENSPDWSALQARIDDLEELMSQLMMLIDFFDMKGLGSHRVATLHTLVGIKTRETSTNFNELVRLQSLLGLQYLRMGYTGKAGIALAKAQNWEKKEGVQNNIRVQWHLAYTEYLVAIQNIKKAQDHFDVATAIVTSDEMVFKPRHLRSEFERRIYRNRMIADASYVSSLLCFEQGDINESLVHARLCIRLNMRAWVGLEALFNNGQTEASHPQITLMSEASTKLQQLLGKMQDLGFTNGDPLPVQSSTLESLNAPLLWSLVPSLYTGLIHLSSIYRHQGMFQEAVKNMDDALKAVEAVEATPLVFHALSVYGDLKMRAGETAEGVEMLERAIKMEAEVDKRKELTALDCSLGYMHRLEEAHDDEFDRYCHAEATLDELMGPSFISGIDGVSSAEAELLDSLEKLDLQTQASPPPPPSKRTLSRKSPKKAAKAPAKPSTKPAPKGVFGECSTLQKLKGNLLRLKAYNMSIQEQFDEAERFLRESEMEKVPHGYHELFFEHMARAKNTLSKVIYDLKHHVGLNLLMESTMSVPNIISSKEPVQEFSTTVAKKGKSKGANTSEKVAKNLVDELTRARDQLLQVHLKAARIGSIPILNSISSLLSTITVYLSAVTQEHPLFASYPLELNKGISLLREKDVLELEKAIAADEGSIGWPSMIPSICASYKPTSIPFDHNTFQTQYIDIIPPTWAVVSISLSENHEELFISRLQAKHSQFVVRLPIARNLTEDVPDEEKLTYPFALEEIKEIVELANSTAHEAAAATRGGREAKAEWWQKREALDTRLKDLLSNMENYWLAGFKGIFGQTSHHPAALEKFRAAFDKILGSHLPSRRRRGKKAPDNILRLDPRIYELFVGVGTPEMDGIHGEIGEDISESLIDLYYFVMDTLTFHGEQIPIEELEHEVKDSIVVELTEALKAYHAEVSRSKPHQHRLADHTILILDKSVQMFPWESLPCLSSHPTSRLPSIQSLHDILHHRQMQSQNPPNPRPGIYIPPTNGTSILNPSSDLLSTQTLLTPPLTHLSTTHPPWTSITNHPPSEAEFSKYLSTSPLFLYFGHGSGGQYIRPRAVKKLSQCSVALLMGCSSGAIREQGEFGAYGMPLAYLLGGSPAVVANLWDVTDRDIDRFSVGVLGMWGLFEDTTTSTINTSSSSVLAPKTPSRSRSKSRTRLPSVEVEEKRTSLVEAVVRSREKCHLRYLNGAAPVVYGVPVYIER